MQTCSLCSQTWQSFRYTTPFLEVSCLNILLQQQNNKLGTARNKKGCYVELSHIQQTQHAQMSQQIQKFISFQQKQLEKTGCRLNRAEHKLLEFGLDVARVKEAHQADVKSLEERQCSTEGWLEALESGIQVGVSERSGRIAKELQASQNQQMEDFR